MDCPNPDDCEVWRDPSEGAWSKRLRNGRTVTVTPAVDPTGVVRLVATIDGTVLAEGWVIKQPAAARPEPDYTHRLGQLALTTAEASQLVALLSGAQRAADATPEGARRKLHRERAQLAADLAVADQVAADNRPTDSEDIGRYVISGQDKRDESAIAAAETRLADFDTAHPEIRDAVEAERKAAVNRAFDQ